MMHKFNDVLGPGEFVVLFNRHTSRANLAFQSPSTRIPIDLLGSGILHSFAPRPATSVVWKLERSGVGKN
jgi:hypothetical protein